MARTTTRRGRRSRQITLLAAVVLVAATSCLRYEPGQVRIVPGVTDLGALNASDRAVATKGGTAVIYDERTTNVTPIPTPGAGWVAEASTINDAGLVAGIHRGPADVTVPFTYDSVTGIVDDIALPAGWTATAVEGPNDQGRVLVRAANGGTRQVFLYRTDDGSTVALDRASLVSVLGDNGNPIDITGLGYGDTVVGDDYPSTPGQDVGGSGPFVLDTATMTAARLPGGTTFDWGVNRVTLTEVNGDGIVVGDDWSCSVSTCTHAPYVYDLTSRQRVTLPGAPPASVASVMEAYDVVIDDHDLVLVDGPYTEMWWYDLSDGSTGAVPRPANSPASPVWFGCSATAPNVRSLVTGGCWASAASPRFVARLR